MHDTHMRKAKQCKEVATICIQTRPEHTMVYMASIARTQRSAQQSGGLTNAALHQRCAYKQYQ